MALCNIMMTEELFSIVKHAFTITGFVMVMMLIIEYINVQTKGLWQNIATGKRWKQYVIAAALGSIPGCLGVFTVVALFSHRLLSFGALVTAMIATSGDEAFVMLAMFPDIAIYIIVLLFVISIIGGYLADKLKFVKNFILPAETHELPLHEEDSCTCFKKEIFIHQLTKPSIYRVMLALVILLFLIAIITGLLFFDAKNWIRLSVMGTLLFSLFVVITVPDHFLKAHLWEHIIKKHIPRIFAWTFGTLLIISLLMTFIDVSSWISDNMAIVLITAVLVGIIPESGPHLIFVTLFAQGSIPFSVLLASSIAQDGHGSLPLLAQTTKGFIMVKLINVVYALLIGAFFYWLGW